MIDVLWKGLVGGLVTMAIVLASRRGNVLPGILPLAPTFAIIALLAVGAKGDAAGFRAVCLAGAKTIPAYLVFLAAAWWLGDRLDYRLAILGALAAWLVAAGLIFWLPRWL
ncbi:GlpM family protein [Methylobacterium oxalidis]|uniref:Membrane protein GlpM n=1 Tax=Methylobacterium oxalidis TaxID=944322 RepID=A0A512IX11_9HYPH|nr:GlpM family protein [Methylobacterium oxalidis]GEP02139.1 membrane protein GlpM [Methylobacterium oxalidis]GJE32117.1 Inner membrane protein YdgC [Methylobacterium oxalidis]GLS62084.1 membrane protein GlpM [Methylobacterium oxalidis]